MTITIHENGGISAVCNGSYEPEVNMQKYVHDDDDDGENHI